jgi:acyl-CoA synthetase (AMP-forming)/AMP-acid ligase II
MTEAVAVLDEDDPVAAFRELARVDGRLALPTSGTTGAARTILRTTRSWTDSFPTVSRLTGLTATSRVWLPGPLTATMNLFAAVHADWAGAHLVDALAEATHLHLTPARLDALLCADAGLSGRVIVVAGDALDPDLRRCAETAGATVAHYYGAAELSFVAWGADLGFLYNDPYAEILGAKHPAALGRRFRDIWAEIWPDISPLIDAAMNGQSARFTRQDGVEETWRIMQPLLDAPPPVETYAPGSWGPAGADRLVAGHGRWHAPWVD